jgi:hypothetical protein
MSTKEFRPVKNLESTPTELQQEDLPAVFPAKAICTDKVLEQSIRSWHTQDKSNHFMTPKWLIDFIRFVYPIELDAASSPEANQINEFERIYTKESNALLQSWKVKDGFGVFVNPPYVGKPSLSDWASKISNEYQTNCQPIFALVPARSPETKWFRIFFENATHIVFLKRRLNHNETISNESGQFASALVVFGGDQLGSRIDLLENLGELVETAKYRKQREKNILRTNGQQIEFKKVA